MALRDLVLRISCYLLLPASLPALAQRAPSMSAPPVSSAPAAEEAPQQTTAAALPPPATYNKSIFQGLIPSSELTFLRQYDHAPTRDLVRDKQFKHVLKQTVPGWEFHYSRDMSLPDALALTLEESRVAVTLRDGRYLSAAGQATSFTPHPEGRGFLWIDLQDGVVLGAFWFHPGNGEPTPSMTIFSKQLKVDSLAMSQLPPAFVDDLNMWAAQSGLQPLMTRYFIGDLKMRILLEHDEDFCGVQYSAVAPTPQVCAQMNSDAADLDLNTAYYLEQVHYATNATAHMITGQEQVAFVELRGRTCGGVADPLGCRVRLTREHIHVVQHRRR